MPLPVPHVDPASIDLTRPPLASLDVIRRHNPQRHEMELLTAVVWSDPAAQLIVGYKDVAADEFWARGHMPGYPLLPGVLMCEAAAQLLCFYASYHKVAEGVLMALAAVDGAKFRRPVRPGDRLVLVGKGLRVKPRMTTFNVQGYVGTELAFEAEITGMSLGKMQELTGA